MIPQYLSDLLLRFDSVILPGLGLFQLKNVPASIKEDKILPPGKILLFDPSVQNNDGVLANHISEKNKISFFDACAQILDFVEEIQKKLNSGNEVTLEKIGILKKDPSGEIIFSADTTVDYNIDSFGLTAVAAIPHMKTQQEIKQKSDRDKLISEKKKKLPVAAVWITAAVLFLCAVSAGIYFLKPELLEKIGINTGQHTQSDKSLITFKDQKNNTKPNKSDSIASVQHGDSIHSQQKENTHYYIITASFRIKENADNYSAQLNNTGHRSEIIFVPGKNLYAVSIDSFNDSTQAGQALAGIKMSTNPAAWIMEK